MDDEKLAVQLNLSDFEATFELKTNEMSEEVRLKKEAGIKLRTKYETWFLLFILNFSLSVLNFLKTF